MPLTTTTDGEYYFNDPSGEGYTMNSLSSNYAAALTVDYERLMRPIFTAATTEQEESKVRLFLEKAILSDLSVYRNRSNPEQIGVFGYQINDQRFLFMFDSEVVVAKKGRTDHLIDLLKAFAEREGLALEFSEEVPFRKGEGVTYCAFKNLEVDDSELLAVNQPSDVTYDHRPSSDVCGDPSCVECYSDEIDEDTMVDWD